MANNYSEKEKIMFGKIFGTLLAIYNNSISDDKIPDYIVNGLTHGIEPIIDDVIDGGHFNLTSEDFSDICSLLEKYQDKDIKGLYDILEHRNYGNLQWKYALSILKDRKQFVGIIDKIENSNNSPVELKNLSMSNIPLIYYV